MYKMGKCKNITWFRSRINCKSRKPYIIIRYHEKISESQCVIYIFILRSSLYTFEDFKFTSIEIERIIKEMDFLLKLSLFTPLIQFQKVLIYFI